ncbi:MAG TPA: amidohydrolase family protein [Roseiflexaceae bacterium]|nr:amidohydrolase family protein [Roseiflexaceae bacterium]
MSMSLDLTTIPIVDHHCHSLRRPGAALLGDEFRRFFAETTDPRMAGHIRHTVFYMRMLRDVAAVFGCAPTEEALLELRAATPAEAYARRLFDAGNFRALLVDTGFGGPGAYTTAELCHVAGRPVETIIRLETLMEQLIIAYPTMQQVEDALRAELRAARDRDVVGFKSIAAYRGGLQVQPRTFGEAAAAFPALKETARRYGRVRLADRAVLEYLLRAALEEAAATELPVQFHVAFGDDDADLRSANPLELRALLTDEAFRRVPFVLLHCYPYVREAGYLAALYAHVFIDVSLAVPLTAHGCTAAFAEALELAPISKLLFATDAHSVPELFYAGALHGRRGLGQALGRLVAEDILSSAQTEDAAEAILWRNAVGLYQLGS